MSDEENWDTDEPTRYPTVSQPTITESSFSDQQRGFENRNTNRNRGNFEDHSNQESRSFESRGGGGGGNRGKFEEMLDINSSHIGMIIGRGGSNIKQTQQDYRVHLDIDRQNNTVKISGNDQNDVQSALEHIKGKMDNNQERGGGGGRGGGRGGGGGGGGSYNRNNDGGNRANRTQGNRNGYNNYNNYDEQNEKKDFYNSSSQPQNDFYNSSSQPQNDFYNSSSQPQNDFYNSSSQQQEENFDESPIAIDWDAVNKKSEIERAKRWAKCPPLTKNFYKENPEVANLSKEQVATIRLKNNNISVSRVFKEEENEENDSANDIPNPVWKFEHCFEPYPDLLEEIKKQGFTQPSPIQAQAWPVLLKGEDIIGIAQTGTGKTLAFLLPAMIHTEYQSTPRSERGGPNVLVMAPTRELALQIEKEVNKYSFRGMKAVCVYGGGDRRDQISNVQKGVEIIICTPGRLNDLIQAKVIDVNTITYLVLDEADRMLDMGFEPQIRKILLDIRPDRQTVMTSATWPPGVRRLAQSYMDNPIQICVGTLDLAATHTVNQVIEIVEDEDKYRMVKNFIKNMAPDDKIIIFCGRKTRADDLSSDLTLEGELCQCIHGSRDQADREQAISDITTGQVRILIATDVASRGLDIEDITHVINFDFPRNIEEYVHRVGRTGRAGRTGTSISYLTRSDWGMAQPLIDILQEAEQEVPDEILQMAQRFKAMKERRANELDKIGDFRGSRRGGGGGGRGGGGRGGGGRDGGGRFGGDRRNRF